MSDSELERLRDEMYAIARVLCGTYRSLLVQPFDVAIDAIDPGEREAVTERAAILEFEARMPRKHAEHLVLATVVPIPSVDTQIPPLIDSANPAIN